MHGGIFRIVDHLLPKNMWIVHIKLPECGGEFPILRLIGNFRRRSVRSGFTPILENHSSSPTMELPSWLTLNQSTSHLSTSLVVLHLYSKGSSEVVRDGAFWMFLSQVSGCFLMFPSTNPCSLEQSRRKRETWRLLVGISDFEVLSSMRSAQNTHISQKCWWKNVKNMGVLKNDGKSNGFL